MGIGWVSFRYGLAKARVMGIGLCVGEPLGLPQQRFSGWRRAKESVSGRHGQDGALTGSNRCRQDRWPVITIMMFHPDRSVVREAIVPAGKCR